MIVQQCEAIDFDLEGSFLIRPLHFKDERGDFFKLYTGEVMKSKQAESCFVEEYLSFSKFGVVRGLHYQRGQASQAKLVRCIQGEIYDVIVDLRSSSPTFGKWAGVTLSEKNMLSLYVPRGFAHGFAALSKDSAVLYKADNDYSPKDERGIPYNDGRLAIAWPKQIIKPIVSDKDAKWPSFDQCEKFE